MTDYIVYTASDPDAFKLEKELREKGFIVAESPSDIAMVVIIDAKPSFLKTIKAIAKRDNAHYWKIAKVNKESQLAKFTR